MSRPQTPDPKLKMLNINRTWVWVLEAEMLFGNRWKFCWLQSISLEHLVEAEDKV